MYVATSLPRVFFDNALGDSGFHIKILESCGSFLSSFYLGALHVNKVDVFDDESTVQSEPAQSP